MKKSKLLLTFFALTTVLCLGACSSAPKAKDGTVSKMQSNDLDSIMEDNKQKENYLVIDIRDEDEYEKGHAKHAINIEAEDLEKNLDKIDDLKESNIVVIANSSKDSEASANLLTSKGYKKVFNSDGYNDSKLKTLTKVSSIRGKEFAKIVEHANDIVVLDARDEKDYQAGHIKGAIHVTADTVESKLNEIPKGKNIFTYCYSGNRSYQVASKLVENGYKDVTNVLDGTKEYKEYKLEK